MAFEQVLEIHQELGEVVRRNGHILDKWQWPHGPLEAVEHRDDSTGDSPKQITLFGFHRGACLERTSLLAPHSSHDRVEPLANVAYVESSDLNQQHRLGVSRY